MLHTERLIKNVAFDIISVITIWGILNNLNTNVKVNNVVFDIFAIRTIVGFGASLYILHKY